MLWDICVKEYFPRNLRLRSQVTRLRYLYAICDLRKFLGRKVTLEDLDDDTIAPWLHWLVDVKGVCARSANGEADRIRALWNWLAKRGRVSRFPTLGKLLEEEPAPVAWTQEELQRLFAAALSMPGTVGPFRADVWWQCLLAWLWNTGERIGATFDMEWKHVDLTRCVAVLPASIRKGQRKSATYHLWPSVVEMLRRIERPTGRVLPWDRSVGTYYNHYTRLLKLAGLPVARNRKSHALRVSHATWVAIAGGDACQSLQHSNPATTRKHYLDKSLLEHAPQLFQPW